MVLGNEPEDTLFQIKRARVFVVFLAIVTRREYICDRGPTVSPDHRGKHQALLKDYQCRNKV